MEPVGWLAGYTAMFLAVFAWERMLDVLNLRYSASRRDTPPQQVRAVLDGAEYRRAVDYALARGRLGLVEAAVQTALLLAVLWTGLLGGLAGRAERLPVGPALQGAIYLLGLGLASGLVSLPFSLYRQFHIEERFGFNRMGLGLFLVDRLKGLLLSALLLAPLLVALLLLAGRGGRWWWLIAFLLAAAFQLLLDLLGPAVIAPLFNRFTPLAEGPLRERIDELARRLDFRTRGIFVMDSSRRSRHGNAYLAGLGRAKRIVLFDTLLSSLEEEQVVAVLAHEIGHARHHHLGWTLAASLAGLLAACFGASLLLRVPAVFRAFGFAGPNPPGLLVLVGLFAGPLSALLEPLASWWSRRQEYEADRESARAVGRASPLVEGLIRLGRTNLSNPVSHPLYRWVHYFHPTLPQRIRALESLPL